MYVCTYVCLYVCMYIRVCHEQNAGQNHNIKTDNKPFKNMAKLKYFGTSAINQN